MVLVLWAPVNEMAILSAVPARFVSESRIVNIPPSELSSIESLFQVGNLALILLLDIGLEVPHLLPHLVRLLLVILGDLLVENHAADGAKLVHHRVKLAEDVHRSFLQSKWLLLDGFLELILDLLDLLIDLSNSLASLTTRMLLVLDDGLGDLVLTLFENFLEG